LESHLARGEIIAEIDPPHRNRPKSTQLRVRAPDGWQIVSANLENHALKPDSLGTVDISSLTTKTAILFHLQRSNN
jgi:hypothetical protein